MKVGERWRREGDASAYVIAGLAVHPETQEVIVLYHREGSPTNYWQLVKVFEQKFKRLPIPRSIPI